MTRIGFEKSVPSTVPGATITPDDMARVTPDDWRELRTLARGYCRTVDSTRARKRADGSATAAGAPYGTDDVSDDVHHDAVFLFAQRLRDILATCAPAPDSGWIYVRRDGGQKVITRTTLLRWAVRDAAARNGYRTDVPAEEIDATMGAQVVSARAAVEFAAAQHGEEIFRQAFGDGAEFPVLKDIIAKAEQAEDLGRAGVLAQVAQERHGGSYGSRRSVIRTRDAARVELKELSERLDEARNAMLYTGMESPT